MSYPVYYKAIPFVDATGANPSGTGGADVTTMEIPDDITPFSKLEMQLNSGVPPSSPNTPTCTVKLQGTFDGTNWFDMITFTGTTTAAAQEKKAIQATATVFLGRRLRLSASIGTADTTVAAYPITLYLIGRA